MKSSFFFALSVLPCLSLISFFVYCTYVSKQNRFFRIGGTYILVHAENPHASWHEMMNKHLTFPLDQHYGSHAIVLLAALYVSRPGPVLELGMGPTSTPLLHRLAAEQNRSLLSADSDRAWVEHFLSTLGNTSFHRMKHVEVKTETGVEWALASVSQAENWTIVFIDHRPGPRRQFDLTLYAERSELVILHDTEQSALYQYERGLALYPHQYRFTKLKTFTDVLSLKHETLVRRIRYLLESTPDSYYVSGNGTV